MRKISGKVGEDPSESLDPGGAGLDLAGFC